MKSTLFFICPCDYLESEIKYRFSGSHYFYTAIGNNYIFNHKSIEQINSFLNKNFISKIIFVANFRSPFYVNTINENLPTSSKSIKSVQKVFSNLKKHINPITYSQFNTEIQLKILASTNLKTQINKLLNAYCTIYAHQSFEYEAYIFDENFKNFDKINKFLLISAFSGS